MMKREDAIKYLKFLHQIENNYRQSIITFDIAEAIQEVRLEFIKASKSS